jgi:hypothetical protein
MNCYDGTCYHDGDYLSMPIFLLGSVSFFIGLMLYGMFKPIGFDSNNGRKQN